jgi:surfeit locus 1 family protein
LIPTLATLLMLLLFVYLGQWQAGKAQRLTAERSHFAAQAQQPPTRVGGALVNPEQLRDAPITVRGWFEPAQQFFVDNRQENGRPGVHVVTPLKIEGSETRILINRGWLGWPDGRKNLPQVLTPTTLVEISGIAALPVMKNFLLMPERAEAWPNLWPRLDLKRFQGQVAYPVQALVLLQNRVDAQDGLLRNWQPPEDRVAMHQSYAMQWYGIALALLVFYGLASVHKGTKS